MKTHFRIPGSDASINVNLNDMDHTSYAVQVSLERETPGMDTRRADEMFLTPFQLEELGRFFLAEARRIMVERSNREFI